MPFIDTLKQGIISSIPRQIFEPSGTQEDIIKIVGSGEWDIVFIHSANKGPGKTCTVANILKNIMWPNDKTWFDYPVFNKWPYPKGFRITGTRENLKDNSPIRSEIKKWWPSGRYTESKNSKAFISSYETDTGFTIDCLSYDQDVIQFEGPVCGLVWSDEPPPAKFFDAITSRFSEGGVWIISATPVKCGIFVDMLQDVRDKGGNVGKKVIFISSSLYENSIASGKPNSRGTKCGTMTDENINKMVSSIVNDVDSRVYGKLSAKAGKVYPMFDYKAHVEFGQELGFTEVKSDWNCFMSMDPHNKYYPAISWWGITKNDYLVCYNEYPSFDTFNGFYDEKRHSEIFVEDFEKLSTMIKILDMSEIAGNKILKRFVDPRFAVNTTRQTREGIVSIMSMFAPHGIKLTLPPYESIEAQRITITELLKYDTQRPLSIMNHPRIFIMPHCKNMIRAMQRHHYEEDDDKESETFKDFVDTLRYVLAGIGGKVQYVPEKKNDENKNEKIVDWVRDDIYKNMRSIELG